MLPLRLHDQRIFMLQDEQGVPQTCETLPHLTVVTKQPALQ
jgi:hypothetical protein